MIANLKEIRDINRYNIKILEKLENYNPFIIGNDPFPKKLIQQADNNFVLVGTSMLSVINLANKLRNPNDPNVPQVVIVDNSKQVIELWYVLKNFFKINIAKDYQDFLLGAEGLCEHLLSYVEGYNSKNDCKLNLGNLQDLTHIIRTDNDLSSCRQLIDKAEIIGQSWTNTDIFEEIKKYHSTERIIAYPSNIIPCIENESDRLSVLQSIRPLSKPSLRQLHVINCCD